MPKQKRTSLVLMKTGRFHTRRLTNRPVVWSTNGRFHTRGRTNRLMCKRDKPLFRRTNRLIFVRLERRFSQDDLPVETNKSTTVRHEFTSDGQMVDFLAARKWD